MPSPSSIEAFESALAADWARCGWDPSGSSLLLCVSGGADSIALLHVFHRLAPRLGGRLSAVHVDHRLRPESAADAAFVARVCADLAVPCRIYALDPSSRRAGESVEMWARRERYARFEAALAAMGAEPASDGEASIDGAAVAAPSARARFAAPDRPAPAGGGPGAGSPRAESRPAWILTAHHRDDLVETFFQRLGRGTGPRGLASIPFRRGNIIRPFLARPRAEVRAFAAALGAAWREDASNADVTLDRNWYRHRYLPALRAREPDLDARVAAMAAALASLAPRCEALESLDGLLRIDPAGKPYLDGAACDPVRAGDRESLRFWLQTLARAAVPAGCSVPTVTPAILREFLRQREKGCGALRVQIAPGLAFVREKRGICLVRADSVTESGRAQAKKSCSPPPQRVILENGSAFTAWRWGGRKYSLTARRFPRPASLEFPSPSEDRAIFDADRISCTLLVRIRKDGDRFSPLGTQSRSRKLKTFFNEEKVPAALRDSLPIVVSCHEAGTTTDGESDARSGEAGSPAGESNAPTGEVDALAGEIPAWIPGYGMSDFFKVRGSTTHILELVMKCENP